MTTEKSLAFSNVFSVHYSPHCTEYPIYVLPKMKCAASFPIPIFMYVWAIYKFPGSVCLFGCRKKGRQILGIYKSLTDTWTWKRGDRTLWFCFGNNQAAQFHFLGIHKSEPDICTGFLSGLHLQCSPGWKAVEGGSCQVYLLVMEAVAIGGML